VHSALRVHAFGEPPRLDRVRVPEPGPEDVLVEIAAAVVSHHDATVARGDFAFCPELPYVPGLEGAGRVVAVGAQVDSARVSMGTPVRLGGGGLGHTRPGTWAEHAAVTARAATAVPDGMELGLAAAYGSVAAAAWAALFEVGLLRAGERVGVTGASGAVGSLATQLAARAHAGAVLAWTRSPDRLTPAVQAVAPDEDVEPVDLLVDTIGGPAFAERIRHVRPGGRMVLVGYTAGTRIELSLPLLLAADVTLLPLNMMRRRLPAGVQAELLADVAAGRLSVAVERISPEEIGEALKRLTAGETSGRLVLAW
jgi:NADPH2:quinone reductase